LGRPDRLGFGIDDAPPARKAVNDSGTAQRVIRTVYRKGVRFIGEVSEDGEPPTRAEVSLLP